MAPQPEQQARGNIDVLLMAAGWHVCDAASTHAARGIAIREIASTGYRLVDYLLYVVGKAAGVIEFQKAIIESQPNTSMTNLRHLDIVR